MQRDPQCRMSGIGPPTNPALTAQGIANFVTIYFGGIPARADPLIR